MNTGPKREPAQTGAPASADEPPLRTGPSARLIDAVVTQRMAVALPAGTLLNGKFEVLQVLGKPGGFGIAYLCRDQRLNRQVVVKELFPSGMVTRQRGGLAVQVLEPHFAPDFALQLELLLDEARKLAALDQVDSVVKVYEHFTQNNTAYIVMHHVLGRALGEHLREMQRLDVATLLRWIWQLLDGLEAVHEAGVLHRDIKPDNVLIDQRDHPVLIDFGNAATLREEAKAPEGYFAVSPFYGAPEQYTNDVARMGPWTDLYSVGAVMYVALSGRRPVDAMQRLAGQALPALQQLVPDAPPELIKVIEACLDVAPHLRPANVKALRERLAAFQPMARHWTEFLPNNGYGQRMRRLHAQLQAGRALPRQWNSTAGLLQSVWFFMHRLTLAGAVSAAVSAVVVLLWLWPADPWPALPLALGLAWLLGALPCALFADLLRYRSVSLLGATLPLASDSQAVHARQVLAAQGPPAWRYAPLCALLPLAAVLLASTLDERQNRTRDALDHAIELSSLRDQFKEFVIQHSRPPSADDLPPFTPNGEIKSVEFRPQGLEVVLALPEASGKRVRWLLDGVGRWTCVAVDLPLRFVPGRCAQR